MLTALATDLVTAATKSESAEVCFWEGEEPGDYIRPEKEERSAMVPVEGRVEKLISLDAEDIDALMKELQEELRRGNRRIANILASAVYQRRYDPEARGLALETLATARVRWFESELLDLVRSALDAPEPELQLAGIAAAADLSRANQVAIGRVVRSMAEGFDSSTPLKRAADAFLRRLHKVTSPPL